MKKIITGFVITIMLVHVSMTPVVKVSEEIIGKWKMEQVLEGDQDISEALNPDGDRWIAFKLDGTFASGGGPYGENKGKYIIDDEAETLSLDSDVGEDDDSKWRIKFEGDKLLMNGIGSERQESTWVINRRVEE